MAASLRIHAFTPSAGASGAGGNEDDLPGIGGRLVRVNENGARSTLPRRLFEFVRPAAVIRERFAAEQVRFFWRRRRVVDHHQNPLALHVGAFVVVPLLFRCHDAVPNEDDIALNVHTRLFDAGKGDDLVEVAVRFPRNTERERAVDGGFDDWHLLEVGAVLTARLGANRLQLRRDVLRRLLAARCRRRAAFHVIGRERLQMRLDGALLDFVFRRTRGRRRFNRSRLAVACDQQGQGGDSEKTAHQVSVLHRADNHGRTANTEDTARRRESDH
jgi:hypothetical protein